MFQNRVQLLKAWTQHLLEVSARRVVPAIAVASLLSPTIFAEDSAQPKQNVESAAVSIAESLGATAAGPITVQEIDVKWRASSDASTLTTTVAQPKVVEWKAVQSPDVDVDFAAEVGSTSSLKTPPAMLLPPLPDAATELSVVENEASPLPPEPDTLKVDITPIEIEDGTTEINVGFLVPPPVEGVQTDEVWTEDLPSVPMTFPAPASCEQVDCTPCDVEDVCDQILLENDCYGTLNRSIADYPVLAFHKACEALCWGCHTPFAERWIFWNPAYRECPGPICCAVQSKTVNWRLSSMYLQGCMPDGYALQCFIESVPRAEFHSTQLHCNGPADPGGSHEEAVAIEGDGVKSLQQISLDITPTVGELPPDRAAEKFQASTLQVHIPGTHREWNATSFYWNASLLNHQPLYFEDVNLERHGFSYGALQPFVSGAKFFSRVPALPYLMSAYPYNETAYTLGETRPGSHACYVCERPRLRLDAAAVEAAAVMWLVYVIP